MKKITLYAFGLFILSLTTNAQTNNETVAVNNNPVTVTNQLPMTITPIDKIGYQVKSRNQKTGAWVLMGLGFAGLVSGIIIDVNHADDNLYSTFTTGKTNNTGTIIAIAGGGMMLGSIPLFIASARNKSKAKLSVSTQNTNLGIPKGINKNVTGITMSIPIGR